VESSDRRSALESARGLEKRGQLEAAARAFARLGEVEEASRLLVQLKRHGEAADLVLGHVGLTPATAAGASGDKRRMALKAGVYLTQAGRREDAIALFLALGEPQRAAQVLERAGDALGAAQLLRRGKRTPSGRWRSGSADSTASKLEAAGQKEAALQAFIREGRPGEAARLALALGRPVDAAELFADGGLPYEAAKAFLGAGKRREALGALVRVPQESPMYRSAVAQAVELATALNVLEIHFEHFLTAFIASGPADDKELGVFYNLGRHYARRGFIENADEVYRKILARDPDFRDTVEQLRGLEELRRRERDRFAEALQGEGSWPPQELPDLPDLPDLPRRPASAQTSGGTRILSGPPAAEAPPQQPPTSSVPVPAPPPAPTPDPDSAAPESEARFEPGMTLARRYRLEAVIGEGGMATVFKAHDLELEEQVALKIFRQPLTDDDSLARFRQEIKLSRQLQQPNVTRVYDLGVSGGHRYLTMELLVGETLESRLRRPLRLDEGLEYLIQSCAGLQAAHDRGIIHRDVKPDNLFITGGGVVKVMDFGIAKQQSSQGMTVMGTIAGTPEYMSPEQVNNFTNVTAATDLYSLGVIAFRVATGHLPFVHDELVPLLMMQVQEPPPRPREVNPAVPEALEATILRLLAKDPRQRFESCRALAAELQAIKESL